MQIGATEVVIFAAGAAFWMLLAAIPLVVLFTKMSASSSTVTGMIQRAETTLAAFNARVGGAWYPARFDTWGTRYLPGVRYRCHDVDADLTYTFIQGSSKTERVSLPYLVVAPLPGCVWRESPARAIREALEAIGYAARRIDRRGLGYGVYLEPPEKHRGGNFVAPLVEGIVNVETLVRMTDAACRAARGSVGGETL